MKRKKGIFPDLFIFLADLGEKNQIVGEREEVEKNAHNRGN